MGHRRFYECIGRLLSGHSHLRHGARMNTHDIIGRDTDEAFAMPELSDHCIDAANRTAKLFDAHYPGWQLYSRIVRGDTVYDRQLAAWAIAMARRYTRTRKVNGQAVVAPRGRRNDWIAQAGVDALEFIVMGRHSEIAYDVHLRLGIHPATYARIRGELTAVMAEGIRGYIVELHYQYHHVLRETRAVA